MKNLGNFIGQLSLLPLLLLLTIFLLILLLDLKRLYYLTGVENKPTVFLFNDTQALEESFLEDISNILSSGEVPNLYKPEEFEEVCTLKVLSFFQLILGWALINFSYLQGGRLFDVGHLIE